MVKKSSKPSCDKHVDKRIQTYNCQVCSKTFAKQQHLYQHALTHKEKKFECKTCGNKFTLASHLKRHERIHTGEKPYKCGVCPKSFSDSTGLRLHRFIHTGEKLHCCLVCDKKFALKATLDTHLRVHTGEMPFSCEHCNQKFKQGGNLQTHIKAVHLREVSKFKCVVCSKTLHSAWSLNNHMHIHTGENPYQCHVCGKRFRRQASVTQHLRTHTGEKPFGCEICGTKFGQGQELSTHTRVHLGEKYYKCLVCLKEFFTHQGLRCHKQSIHGIEFAHTCLFTKSEFTPALKDCWRPFLDKLENPKEALTLRNASALFNDADVLLTTRKNSALWSLAIPILLQRGTLSHEGALAVRVVNQEVKAAIDDALVTIQPNWMTNAYSFTTVDDVQRFMEHFDRTAGNPFISMQGQMRVSDAATFERSVELLTHYGHYLQTLNFGMDIPQPWAIVDRRLAQLLPLIPSVKSLKIGLCGFRATLDNPMWNIAMMYREGMPVLPALHFLTSLEVYRISDDDDFGFPDDSFQDLLDVYGRQLNRCACDDSLFSSTVFVNLRHLELSQFSYSGPDDDAIEHIRGLRLESLYLSGDKIPYTNNTVLLLNRVNSTLEELRMDHLSDENGLFELNPMILQQFPKLRRLTVCTSLIKSGLWHVFRHQFLNLEHLRFESRDQHRIPNGAAPNAGQWHTVFFLFHKLETITWVVGGSELLFKRW